MLQRGFIQLPILIAIIVTAILGGGAYVVYEVAKPSQNASPKEVVVEAETQATTTADTSAVVQADEKSNVQESNVKSQDTTGAQQTPVRQETKNNEVTSPQEEISKVATLSATCVPKTNPVVADEKVTFTASASGGKSPYKFSWSGTAISGIETQSVTTQYPTRPYTRTENAFVVVTSSDGQSITANCKVTIQAKQETATNEQTNQTPSYSDSACLDQKQGYLSEVNAAYLSWYDQWQAARAVLSSCYDSNPVPYCDNKMTDVNVEWQAKITATMKSYQDKLTQCAPEKRIFSDISDVVSSSY